MNRIQVQQTYANLLKQAYAYAKTWETMRSLALGDLYYLLTHVLGREDAQHDWLYARCREVQQNPNGYLDLWAREHYKSTIITFALTIQDILNNPEETFGVFSHTRPIAKAFLVQIKQEFERNELLQWLFPDILWSRPHRDAPKWSKDEGIVVKRKSNPKESTIEAWGLVDAQPISKHFSKLIYDDVVTKASVSNPDMIRNVTDCLRLSYNLGTRDGHKRFIGTRYHFNDTYKEVMESGTAIPRVFPATVDGTVEGEPVFLTREELIQKRKEYGSYIFACQMLQNPKEDSLMGFNEKDLRHWPAQQYGGMNIYIVVDPASKKNKSSDYTVFLVIGLAWDQNYYVIDMVRDRLNLKERTNTLFALHRQYRPIDVGYEEYGMQCDREHIEHVMNQVNYRFNITPLGGKMSKIGPYSRIGMLMPIFEDHRIWLPDRCVRENYEGVQEDLVKVFVNDEFKAYPVPIHDDMLDDLANILHPDLGAVFPSQHNIPRQFQAISDDNPGGGMIQSGSLPWNNARLQTKAGS